VSFATVTRIRDAVGDRLDAADVDRLIHGGTSDVRHRSDLHVRTERQLRIARRPASGRSALAVRGTAERI